MSTIRFRGRALFRTFDGFSWVRGSLAGWLGLLRAAICFMYSTIAHLMFAFCECECLPLTYLLVIGVSLRSLARSLPISSASIRMSFLVRCVGFVDWRAWDGCLVLHLVWRQDVWCGLVWCCRGDERDPLFSDLSTCLRF
ncbi:hypothetical protein BKA64DRAFT_354601 [Cadophora sp. MPI-SDFR-AT-0126]|nr:hypothetical protein BKA64DRAFT_354601 [Leotiomycetes sp. MPI-SDFR-AT-0126]